MGCKMKTTSTSPPSGSLKKFHFFLQGPTRNAWLKEEKYEYYVRKTRRILPPKRDGILRMTLDLANITGYDRGKGRFTPFLERIEKQAFDANFKAVFIENVVTERFADYFRKHGYEELPSLPPCFYKLNPHPIFTWKP